MVRAILEKANAKTRVRMRSMNKASRAMPWRSYAKGTGLHQRAFNELERKINLLLIDMMAYRGMVSFTARTNSDSDGPDDNRVLLPPRYQDVLRVFDDWQFVLQEHHGTMVSLRRMVKGKPSVEFVFYPIEGSQVNVTSSMSSEDIDRILETIEHDYNSARDYTRLTRVAMGEYAFWPVTNASRSRIRQDGRSSMKASRRRVAPNAETVAARRTRQAQRRRMRQGRT